MLIMVTSSRVRPRVNKPEWLTLSQDEALQKGLQFRHSPAFYF